MKLLAQNLYHFLVFLEGLFQKNFFVIVLQGFVPGYETLEQFLLNTKIQYNEKNSTQ